MFIKQWERETESNLVYFGNLFLSYHEYRRCHACMPKFKLKMQVKDADGHRNIHRKETFRNNNIDK